MPEIFHGLIFLVKVTCRLWKSTFENLENNALLFTCESVTGIERIREKVIHLVCLGEKANQRKGDSFYGLKQMAILFGDLGQNLGTCGIGQLGQ